MEKKFIKNIEFSKIYKKNDLMSYVEGGVESRTLVQRNDFSMTLFSFFKGESVAAYSMPGDTMIYLFEGKAEVFIENKAKFVLEKGDTVVIPAGTLHGIDTLESSKLMIIILKAEDNKKTG